MSWDIGADNVAAAAAPFTSPLYLLELGFDPVVRLSSRETLAASGESWLSADFSIDWGADPRLMIFNENGQLGQVVLVQGTAGRTVRIWQAYVSGGIVTTLVPEFDGRMGLATIGDWVEIQCRRRPPNRTPRQYAIPPTFNHMPPAGTRFETPKEVIVLERD